MKFKILSFFLSLSSTSALTLASAAPNYLRLIEVYFYDSSDSSDSSERIRLFVDDVMQISKAEFHSSSSSTWTKISDSSDKKYSLLFQVASLYIQAQHNLNTLKIIDFQKRTNSSQNISTVQIKDCCKDCCKDCGGDDCCKDDNICWCCWVNCCTTSKDKCSKLEDKNDFGYFLSNLSGGWKNVYLSPVQAHIKFVDKNLSSDFNSGSLTDAEIAGTLIYTFVDYSYKQVKWIQDSSFDNRFISTSSTSSTSSTADDIYFANLPQYLKFSSNSSSNDLQNILNNLSNKNSLPSATDSTTIECNDTSISSIIKRNYVVKFNNDQNIQNIQNIQNSMKCIKKCTANK